MSLLNINGFNVLTVYATDLEKSVNFYTDILGFEVAQDMEPGKLLYSKGAETPLYIEGGRTRGEAAGTSNTCMAVCLNCADGVKGAHDAIVGADIPIVQKYGDFEGEFAGIQFTDPDGNIIEIAGKP
ncbi:MAG: VOC family protein [Bacteriovoracaceae bacterium]|nr:VOC family protein [Bacteriovoracaceae bacterium]